ncbi:MAG: cobyrinic acid a,c-diamide synthase [uncultured bacterium]|nr:MAG: cobyrinic acid a,c-diamide synthase [uncultured bacterium]
MKIAVASGKGGTGKSTVSINLAYLLSKTYKDVCLLDCDVEEPNCHIFLNPCINKSEQVFMPIPEVITSKCISCGKCAQICEFNALAFVKNFVIVFPELCHSCGGCKLICPAGAITETGREVGVLEVGIASGFNFIYGSLRISEAMSPPLIKAVKKEAENFKLQILDCPPGTSCPVISSIEGADFVILVTEPTPFGLYDLKLAVDVVRKLNLPFGIVINKSGENDSLIESYASSEDIKILTRIPDDRRIAECYSRGEIILRELPEFKKNFEPLTQIVRELQSDKLFGVQK